MPELPEVQTTVNGINAETKNLKITDVWTSYNSPFHYGNDNIKDPKYFVKFKEKVIGAKIITAERKGKNILIHLSNGYIILAHMKMTGHFMYGKYTEKRNDKVSVWLPQEKDSPLSDPFNKNIRLIFTLSNDKHLAFSDTRKFAKVFIFEIKNLENIPELKKLGLDPVGKDFSFKKMLAQIELKDKWKIKQILLDQEIISGIGNIYSDEMLWSAGIHPLSIVSKIPLEKMKKLYSSMLAVLKNGLDFGGDSMSDYRNIYGLPGSFQHKHNVYRRTGDICPKKDGGFIQKIKVGGRSTHFCANHQILYK